LFHGSSVGLSGYNLIVSLLLPSESGNGDPTTDDCRKTATLLGPTAAMDGESSGSDKEVELPCSGAEAICSKIECVVLY
jgi:hypothetical protein